MSEALSAFQSEKEAAMAETPPNGDRIRAAMMAYLKAANQAFIDLWNCLFPPEAPTPPATSIGAVCLDEEGD